MEGNRPHTPSAGDCPILCITKVVLYVLVSTFILYLPLGDPNLKCTKREHSLQSSPATHCLCEIYYRVLNGSREAGAALAALLGVALDALHHAKIQFYGLLNKYDKEDLCTVTCCAPSEEECGGARKDSAAALRAPCKCAKNKYCKRKSSANLLRT